MTFGGVVLWRAIWTGHMAIATANTDLLIHHDKTIFPFMHCSARTDFGTCRVGTMVARNGEIIGKDILMPDAVILLPVTTRILINAAEADIRGQIFVVFAGQFAGFTTGATAGINKNPYWVVIGYSLYLFDLNEITVRRISFCQR